MGVDTKILLTKAPPILDLLKYATETYTGANLSCAGSANFYWLNFKDGKDERSLSVFPPEECASDYANLWQGPAVYVSMGCWGRSEVIARKMAIFFGGGFIMPNDCTDDWQPVEMIEVGAY